jgi:hypothetical protein
MMRMMKKKMSEMLTTNPQSLKERLGLTPPPTQFEEV